MQLFTIIYNLVDKTIQIGYNKVIYKNTLSIAYFIVFYEKTA
nr:MAG TPA: hypothetical protein [Caudoviricetes sp.]